MRAISRDIVAGLVISQDNKFLLGMKDPAGGGVYIDCWHIPGGGIDKGETRLEALAREMYEETGIDVSKASVTLLDNQGHGEAEKTLQATGEIVKVKMKFYVYKVQVDQRATDIVMRAGDDLQKLIWTSAAQLKELKLTPPSTTLFTRLGWLREAAKDTGQLSK